MSYAARVFNVMIASPRDVGPERAVVREVLHEWNAIHAASRQVVLLPAGWESHSSPEMGARPQEIINQQVLANCDILIGVFWTRIGTATGEYASGTVEEIEEHIALGRTTMLYFSNQPVHPESIEPEQYAELKRFKKSCQGRGLYETYDALSEFKEKFFRQLQIKLNDSMFTGPQAVFSADESIPESASPDVPRLSEEARILLIEASGDNNGTIMLLRYIGGTDLQTNNKNLIASQDRRTVAKWESALEELVNHELVVARGYKNEIFEVTSRGYQIADILGGN